jgi:signal transduction histidine kinase
MRTATEILFFLTFFITLLLGGLSFVISRRLNSHEFKHLTLFWASLGTMTVISYIFQSNNEAIVALSLFGWIWPLFAINQVAEDISKLRLMDRTKIMILTLGVLTTLILANNFYPFMVYTAGFTLAYGVVGGIIIYEVYRRLSKKHLSILGSSTLVLLALYFVIQMTFPLWRMNQYFFLGMAAHLLVLVSLAASTISFFIEKLNERDEKKIKSVLKERNDQLLSQSKYSELGMMSAGIAHEINNPLAIIQAKTTQLLRIVREPTRVQEISDGLEQILYTSERINRTIQGVRAFAHQDEHNLNEEFSVKTLMDDVLAFCGQRMKNHGINLRFYGIQDCMLRGYKIQLEQVVLNLLNNAFDAIEFLPDKWIEVTVKETDSSIQMLFKDSGSGIPPETASRMMEAFFTTKKSDKGTGLGLALARGIIEKHGGSLEYVDQGQHTTFKVELPKPDMNWQNVAPREERPSLH